MTDREFPNDFGRITRRQWLSLVGGTVAATGFAGAGLFAQVANAQDGNVLRVVSPHNPTSMAPFNGRHGNDHVMLYPVFDTLIRIDPDTLALGPGLAESWSYVDPNTLVLKIRQGVKFHDGTPLNAEAVAFNLEHARTYELSRVTMDLAFVKAIEATGDHEVTLRLSQPDAVLPAVLSDRAGMMSSPTAMQKFGKEYDRNPVGTGPWKLEKWLDAQELVYARNDDYWGEKPAVDGIHISVIPEVNTGLRTLSAKQNDFIYLLSPQQKVVAERSGLNFKMGPTLQSSLIYLNYSEEPFNNRDVRLAMCHAIDRAKLNEVVMGGLAEPTVQNLPRQHWAYNSALDDRYKHDPALARKLLADAGHPNGIDIDVFIYNDQRSQQTGEVLAEMCREANIRVNLKAGTVSEIASKWSGEFIKHAAVSIYSGRVDPNQYFSVLFDPTSFVNLSKSWGAPELETIAAEARATSDVEQRKVAIHRALEIICDNALCVPLLLLPELDAMLPRVEGYEPTILGKPRFEKVRLAS